jgi:hypothetical protein
MTDSNSSDVLNSVLARLYRSLMQYAVDCWPWSTATDTEAAELPEQKVIEQMTLRQQEFVARLADLVMHCGGAVDLGTFPDNSELHYVSIDYLLGKLIADEQELVIEIQTAGAGLGHDPEAAALVAELLSVETQNVARLSELSRSVSTAAAV